MSTLLVSNVHFEGTGANRIDYSGARLRISSDAGTVVRNTIDFINTATMNTIVANTINVTDIYIGGDLFYANIRPPTSGWNNSVASFIPPGIKLGVTDAGSKANARLFDLQVNNNTFFAVTKTGNVLGQVISFNPTNTITGLETSNSVLILSANGSQFSGGYGSNAVNVGVVSGTYTPTYLGGNLKTIVNNGAFTLAAPSDNFDYTLSILMTNGASAGTVTFSGFNRVIGDTLSTSASAAYFLFITKIGTRKVINIVAAQ